VGLQRVQEHPKHFDLSKIWANSRKIWAKNFDIFLPILMKVCFFVIYIKVYCAMTNS